MIKSFFQRLFRGYSYLDIMNLDITLSKKIKKYLILYKERTIGYPPDMTFEEWENVVSEMIFAFDYYEKSADILFEDENYESNKKRMEDGMKLFIENFRHLWY